MTRTHKALLILAALAMLLSPIGAHAQATLAQTTLSAAVTSASATTVRVTSATGFSAGRMMFVDKEAMAITAVNGTAISVQRGAFGTTATTHLTLSPVGVGPNDHFSTTGRSGSCTSSSEKVNPVINVRNGELFDCLNSNWSLKQVIQYVQAPLANHLSLDTQSDDRAVRINHRDYSTLTSGTSLGFSTKPAQAVASTGVIMGGEISPRVNSGIAVANIIGLHVTAYLKGIVAGTISGDVRSLQVELVTTDAGTRTIGGDVMGLRMRSAFSATTITGDFVAFKIEKPETQTNSKTYTALFKLTGKIPLVWNSAPATEPTTADGYIKVIVNGVNRWIQLYSVAPID